jgi:cation diffusion facilitator family transporter
MAGSSKTVIYAALIGNSLIAVIKFIAAAITGSSAMLSEGIHSLVDTGNQILLLLGLKRAQRPASEKFPYGHGKEIYFWSFVVALLVFAVGAGVSIYEGIEHLRHPREITKPVINYVVLSLAMIFESVPLYIAFKAFRKSKGKRGYFEAIKKGKDPTLFVVLFEDTAAMLGLIVAFIGIYLSTTTGILYFDGASSIIIGLILAITAGVLAYETKGLLIGESARDSVVEGIRRIAHKYRGVEKVNEVLTMHMGPEYILVNLSIEFDDGIRIEQMEDVIAKIDKEIKQKFEHVKRIFIEAESWRFKR